MLSGDFGSQPRYFCYVFYFLTSCTSEYMATLWQSGITKNRRVSLSIRSLGQYWGQSFHWQKDCFARRRLGITCTLWHSCTIMTFLRDTVGCMCSSWPTTRVWVSWIPKLFSRCSQATTCISASILWWLISLCGFLEIQFCFHLLTNIGNHAEMQWHLPSTKAGLKPWWELQRRASRRLLITWKISVLEANRHRSTSWKRYPRCMFVSCWCAHLVVMFHKLPLILNTMEKSKRYRSDLLWDKFSTNVSIECQTLISLSSPFWQIGTSLHKKWQLGETAKDWGNSSLTSFRKDERRLRKIQLF